MTHLVTRLAALGLIAVIAASTLVACGGAKRGTPTPQPDSPPPPPRAPTVLPVSTGGSSGDVVEGTEFAVALQDPGGGEDYVYSPAEMSFKVGDSITFVLTSQSEFHTFTVDDLDIDVSVDAEETVRYTVTFDSPGTFSLICIPHEMQGMVGTITVE